MIDAIEAGDADGADHLARIHTDLFRDRIVRYVNRNLASEINLRSVSKTA
jgi:hypothetical protein